MPEHFKKEVEEIYKNDEKLAKIVPLSLCGFSKEFTKEWGEFTSTSFFGSIFSRVPPDREDLRKQVTDAYMELVKIAHEKGEVELVSDSECPSLKHITFSAKGC